MEHDKVSFNYINQDAHLLAPCCKSVLVAAKDCNKRKTSDVHDGTSTLSTHDVPKGVHGPLFAGIKVCPSHKQTGQKRK